MHSIADLKSIGVAIKLPGHDADTYAERRRWRSKKAPSSPEIRLETAVLLGQWDEVIALIESGVDVSHCDNWILRMVTLAGDQAMIRFLVERGADPMAMHPY